MTEFRIYTAFVTFERTTEHTTILPLEAQGACGYMGVAAPSEKNVEDVLRKSLIEVGLRFMSADEITEQTIADFPGNLDEHLAENVRNWEVGKQTVWGTIHVYLADGET